MEKILSKMSRIYLLVLRNFTITLLIDFYKKNVCKRYLKFDLNSVLTALKCRKVKIIGNNFKISTAF